MSCRRWSSLLLVAVLAIGCERPPKSAVVRSLESLVEADQISTALEVAERHLQAHPDDFDAWYWRLAALLKADRLEAAAAALAQMPDADRAIRRALRSSDDAIRIGAVRLVAETGLKTDRALLVRGLTDPVAAVRRYSVRALGKTRDRTVLRRLCALSRDEDWTVRAEVADAFGRIGDERAVGWLMWLLNDTDGYVRHRAEVALLELVSERHRAFLERRLLQGDLMARLPIAAALLRLDGHSGWRAFEEAINHPEAALRQRAARLLTLLGNPQYTNWLQRLVYDPDPKVREQAARGWERIVGSTERPFVVPSRNPLLPNGSAASTLRAPAQSPDAATH